MTTFRIRKSALIQLLLNTGMPLFLFDYFSYRLVDFRVFFSILLTTYIFNVNIHIIDLYMFL